MKISGIDIVERIDECLEKYGSNRAKLSKDLEMNQSTLSTWIMRDTVPKADDLYRIAEYLNVDLVWLITGQHSSGIDKNSMDIAKLIQKLDKIDQQEINDIIKLKLNRYDKERESFLSVEEPSPRYGEEETRKYLDWDVYDIPFLGDTAAGTPIDINAEPNEYMPLPGRLLVGNPLDYFYLRIRGTSMTDANIHDGDYVVIRKTNIPQNGEIMLIRYEDESTIKRILIQNDKVFLCWEDGTGKRLMIDSDNFEIQGIHVYTLRPRRRTD